MYDEKLQRVYNFLTWTGLIVALPVAFLSDWIINVLYGKEYMGAGIVLSISIWSATFVFQGVARGSWIINENLQKYVYIYTSAAAVLNVMLNLIFIPLLSIKGAAIATLLCQFCSVIIFPLLIKKTRKSSIQLLKSFVWWLK